MISSAEEARLLDAIERYQGRTSKGEPKQGVSEALQGLLKALGTDGPARDTPGAREARRVAPGTDGTGEHYSKAAIGRDGPSPGQREARSLSQEIQEAAESIVSKAD